MMNYTEVLVKISEGNKITRTAWGACKIIRKAIESDGDYINYPLDNLIVEDCKQKVCDCPIGIYRPTTDDLEAKDFIIVE